MNWEDRDAAISLLKKTLRTPKSLMETVSSMHAWDAGVTWAAPHQTCSFPAELTKRSVIFLRRRERSRFQLPSLGTHPRRAAERYAQGTWVRGANRTQESKYLLAVLSAASAGPSER